MAASVLEKDVFTRIARVLLGALWLGATLWGAAVCLSIAVLNTATFFGEPPTKEMLREAVLFSLAGAIAAGAGPLGVWIFHRRRGWLFAGGAFAAVGIGYAAYILWTVGLR